MASPPLFVIKRNDLLPTLDAVLKDAAGNAVLIQGGTVEFHMRQQGVSVLKINTVCTNLDDGQAANKGKVRYEWSGTDTDTEAFFEAEFEVTLAGKPQTFPNPGHFFVSVVGDLA